MISSCRPPVFHTELRRYLFLNLSHGFHKRMLIERGDIHDLPAALSQQGVEAIDDGQ